MVIVNVNDTSDQQCRLEWWRDDMGTGFNQPGTGFAAEMVLTSLMHPSS